MNRRFHFSLLALALTALAAVAFVVGRSASTRAAGANGALAALPASDFVISIDAQRALNETLPSLLASNPAALAKFNAELDEFQRKTGINPRTFESIAVGGSFNSSRPDKASYTVAVPAHGLLVSAPGAGSRTVVIARGSFRSDELLETAFAAAKAKDANFQKAEQQYEGRTIFLVGSVRDVKGEMDAGKTLGQVLSESKSEKMALTALDSNTIAAGDIEGVRAAIDASLGRNRVDDELVRLASETPGAVIGFSGRAPQNFGGKSPDNAIEKYFASIRQFYGSFSADGTDAQGSLTLRTETTEQANDLGQALNALKSLSAFGFSRSSGSAKDASVGELLRSLSVTTLNNEVQISFKIPQASIAPLIKTR